MALQWTEEMVIGVRQIDEQHRELLEHADALMEAAEGGAGADELLRLWAFVASCASNHFATEERLMARYAYFDAGGHKHEHARILSSLQVLRSALQEQGLTTLVHLQIRNRVGHTLESHLANADRRLGAFLRAHMGTAAAL